MFITMKWETWTLQTSWGTYTDLIIDSGKESGDGQSFFGALVSSSLMLTLFSVMWTWRRVFERMWFYRIMTLELRFQWHGLLQNFIGQQRKISQPRQARERGSRQRQYHRQQQQKWTRLDDYEQIKSRMTHFVSTDPYLLDWILQRFIYQMKQQGGQDVVYISD